MYLCIFVCSEIYYLFLRALEMDAYRFIARYCSMGGGAYIADISTNKYILDVLPYETLGVVYQYI